MGGEAIKFIPSPIYEARISLEIFVELYVSIYSLLNKLVGSAVPTN